MWNYRVVKVGTGKFAIREVYYNYDQTIFGMTCTDSAPFGETKKELKKDLKAMLKAFRQSLLVDGKVKYHPHKTKPKKKRRK